jgi:UDP-3-O-[3-hydroxymyristoyl] glucosamine N-acyltransferase
MTNNIIIEGLAKISESAIIKDYTIIGKKYRPLLSQTTTPYEKGETIINDRVYIGYYCIIGEGSSIGLDTKIDDRITIESEVEIGSNNLIIYNSQICNEVKIGDNCVIGGFVGEGTLIGNNCRIFGKIVHPQHNPLNPWDDVNSMEKSPKILDNVFIGFNSVIAAPIVIGPNSYVCSGSIITKDVPKGFIGHGVNKLTHFTKWNGELSKSPIFK